MPSIVISGWYGQRNVGDEAMLEVLLREIRDRIPDATFTVLCEAPEEVMRSYRDRFPLQAIPHPSPYGFKAVLDRGRRQATRAVWRAVRDAELFVLGGGSLVRDHNLSNFSRVVDELFIAQRAGVPTAVLGVTVGPLRTRWGRSWSRRLLGRASVLAVRDRESERVLEAIGIPDADRHRAGDLTLLLEAAAPLEAEGPAPIVVSPCGAMLRGLPDGPPGNPELVGVLAQAADALHRDTGAPIRFVPFRSGVPGDDDALLSARIAAEMSDPRAATVADHSSNPAAVKGELATARLVIGARLHAIIFAASRGVPVVGIAYGSKVRRFLEDLGLGDFALDPAEVTTERLLECSQRWVSEGAALLAPARERLDAAAATLTRTFDQVAALVR